MVGLVVAAHGRLAEEFVATSKLIIGEFEQVAACGVPPGASPEEIRSSINEAVHSVDSGDGVVLFADLVGGSPCSQGLQLCKSTRLEVLTGVNLPMLIKAISWRNAGNCTLEALAGQLVSYGQRNISRANDALGPRSTGTP
jgi:PTS system mannose-specific IIA component